MKRLPLTPRPIKGELLSSWTARVSAVNGITLPELIKYATGSAKHDEVTQIDRELPRSLIAGLAQACCIPEENLAEIDLCAQLPNAPAGWLLPAIHDVPSRYNSSTISIPSCHSCLVDHERADTIPYWRADWGLALMTLCPDHLEFLSQYCNHCLIGLLTVVAHPKRGGPVVRCTLCFKAAMSHPVVARIFSPHKQLVASLGRTLVSACRAINPDPMWLGPINAAKFLSVIDDLIWFFIYGNLDGGYPLIARCAPATYSEMSAMKGARWQRPLNLLSVRQREIITAAVAIALLGSRINEHFDPHPRLPTPESKPDAYPFSSVALFPADIRTKDAIMERVVRWPAALKQRALLHLPSGISTRAASA